MRYLTALLVLASSTAMAQKAPAPSGPAAAVLEQEESWAQAMVKRDRATFERLLAPRFIYSEDTTTYTRAQTLESLFGADVYTEVHNENMEVQMLGDVAIVTGWLVVNGYNKTAAFNRRYRFTDTWMHGTNWRIVAAHDVLVARK